MNDLPKSPGNHRLVFAKNQNRYALSLPADYPNGESYPLILVLHWGGPVNPYTGKVVLDVLIEPAWKNLNAIMIAPDRLTGSWANPEAAEHVFSLLDHIQENYAVDTHKIVVSGYSMGANGSFYLAGNHPERFTAAVPIAGWPPKDADALEWETPLYILNSDADELIPLGPTQAFADKLKAKNHNVEMVVVEGLSHPQAEGYVESLAAVIPWLENIWNV